MGEPRTKLRKGEGGQKKKVLRERRKQTKEREDSIRQDQTVIGGRADIGGGTVLPTQNWERWKNPGKSISTNNAKPWVWGDGLYGAPVCAGIEAESVCSGGNTGKARKGKGCTVLSPARD